MDFALARHFKIEIVAPTIVFKIGENHKKSLLKTHLYQSKNKPTNKIDPQFTYLVSYFSLHDTAETGGDTLAGT